MAGDNVIPFPGERRGLSDDDIRNFARDLVDKSGSPQQALAALMATFGVPGDDPFGLARRRPTLLRKRTTKAAFVVRVDLDHAKPPIWRRLRLASDLTLAQVHDVLQVAMGWSDSHLHQFEMGPGARDRAVEPFLTDYDLSEGDDGIPEADVRLDQVLGSVGDRLYYEYDFGDGWRHTIKLEKVLPWPSDAPQAECLDGRRACPPEDVGGLGGYGEALEALAGTSLADEGWLSELLVWLPPGFDPATFSVAETNELLHLSAPLALDGWHPGIADLLERMGGPAGLGAVALINEAIAGPCEVDAEQAEVATRGYRLLLEVVGAGLKLTAAGYLPPRVVEDLVRDLPLDLLWGKGNREDHTYPIRALRESATLLGLVRKSRGQLLPTKLGRKLAADPPALLEHIASKLPLGRPHERDAGLLALLFTAGGTPWRAAHADAAVFMSLLGWMAQGDQALATYYWSRPTMEVLDALTGVDPLGDDAPPELGAVMARVLLRRP